MTELPKKDFVFFRSLSIILVTFVWIAFSLTLISTFYTPLIWLTWILTCLFLWKKKILTFPKPSKEIFIYIFIGIIFASSIAFFTEPTIFAGRDQGAIAETALNLSRNHTLLFKNDATQAFFEIYGKGQALNFPGFFYTADGNLLTQFPLPYISFLASFTGIFNLNGFIVANFVLTFYFILALSFLVRYLLNKKYTLVFLLLFTTSFTASFFTKFTLSENLAGPLLWIAIFLFLRIRENLNKKNFLAFFLSIAILPFTRIEGFWFLAIFSFMFLRNKENRQFIFHNSWHKIILPLVILSCILLANLIMNTPFYNTMAHVILEKFQPEKTIEIEPVENKIDSNNSSDKNTFLMETYSLYGLLLPLILAALMCLKSVLNKKYRFFIFPIGIILPLFFYYLSPQISLDHPWMLRRFSFALVPATLVVSVVFIATIEKKFIWTKYVLIFILLLSNLISFLPFFTYRENTGLNEQIQELAKQFDNDDLILVDKNVAGNGWTMITTPLNLEGKQAVYFFNPYDFEKLNTEKFKRVFLITPNENVEFYTDVLKSEMSYYNDYVLVTNQLRIAESKTMPVVLPKKEDLWIEGKIFELRK